MTTLKEVQAGADALLAHARGIERSIALRQKLGLTPAITLSADAAAAWLEIVRLLAAVMPAHAACLGALGVLAALTDAPAEELRARAAIALARNARMIGARAP